MEKFFVRRTELLHQQRNALLPTGENRSTSRLHNSLLGNLCFADFVVKLRRIRRVAFDQKPLGAQHTAFGNRGTDADETAGQFWLQRFGRGGIADPPQRHGSRRCDIGVFVLQSPGQELDSPRIAADTDRIDRADQQSSFERLARLPQRFVGRLAGNHFQRNP